VTLYRNPDFRRLWTGQVASDLGTNSSQLVVPLLVLGATGSAAWAGALTTLGAVVSAVGRLPGGALADRVNRQKLMVGSDLGRMLLSLGLGLCLLITDAPIGLVVLVVVLSAVLEILFAPAETAAIPRVVPPEQLGAAFAGNEARRSGTSLAGPALGGLFYGLGPSAPFLMNAVTYALSAVNLSRIRTPLQEARATRPALSMATEIGEGVRHVAGNAFLRAVVLTAAPLNFALTGAIFSATVALQQVHASSAVIGLAQAAIGLGGLLGALAAARPGRERSARRPHRDDGGPVTGLRRVAAARSPGRDHRVRPDRDPTNGG
jgi:MFS family permease